MGAVTTPEPTWCSFCEDRPAIGQMVVMLDESRTQITEIGGDGGWACNLHGRAWTGVPVATSNESDEVAVLQYVHPEFEKVTENHIADFADEKACTDCGDPTEPMPLWVAERILRAHPELVLDMNYRWEGICHECAERDGCPHCDGDHEPGRGNHFLQ